MFFFFLDIPTYPLVNKQFAIENGHYIVDLPIKNDGSFHSYVRGYKNILAKGEIPLATSWFQYPHIMPGPDELRNKQLPVLEPSTLVDGIKWLS